LSNFLLPYFLYKSTTVYSALLNIPHGYAIGILLRFPTPINPPAWPGELKFQLQLPWKSRVGLMDFCSPKWSDIANMTEIEDTDIITEQTLRREPNSTIHIYN
jgi:hypothetical protein